MNKVPILLMFPIAAIAIYLIGLDVSDTSSSIVDSSRKWILIFLGAYTINYGIAWFLRNSWTATLIRMLGCGLFAYVAISELVDLLGAHWGNWGQLMGGDGPLGVQHVAAVRYVVSAWTINLVMMILCIAVGFEATTDENQ